jgi:pilus assembly protein CpaE
MRICIVSDHEPTTAQVQEVLRREAPDCLPVSVVPFLKAAEDKAAAQAELVMVALTPDPEPALAVLKTLRSQTRAGLLAVGPASDPRLILRVLHAGANHYVDAAELDSDLVGILNRLKTEVPDQAEPGKIISLLAPSGGAGSSTLAVNCATILAKEHKRCCLFDLKLETGDLAPLLDLKPTYTLADLCQNAASMDKVMFERCLAPHASGVHLLASPLTLADVGYIQPEGIRRALMLARSTFPYVVIDHDHTFREEQLVVLRQSDVILIVLRLDFTSLRNAQRTLAYLSELGISREKAHVVVNRYGQPKEVPAAKAEEALSRKIFHLIPDDPKTINRANNNGIPVVLESPSARVSKSVAQLTHSINGRPKKH